jgi:CRP/FNR family transcriptional regulator, cyclic AMP receptor protein
MADRMLVIPRRKRRMGSIERLGKTSYALEAVEKCRRHFLTADHFTRNLPQAIRTKLDSISSPVTYRKGEILFAEGQPARGVFVIHSGRVKLSADSSDGKSLILRMAGAGEVVGLPGVISGKRYETTGEALDPLRTNYIRRAAFRDFVRAHGEIGLRVAEVIGEIYYATYREVRYLGLSASAEAKLARFLLDLTVDQNGDHRRAQATALPLTHEQIAETVGTSRETVTRLLAEFKRKGLLEFQGSHLLIANKIGLRKLLA